LGDPSLEIFEIEEEAAIIWARVDVAGADEAPDRG
jgi:hypothetical protein